MATLTLFQSNADHTDSNYDFNYRVDYDATGWYMQDSDNGVVFGAIFGSGITYNSYGNPLLGIINSASSLNADGSTQWKISGIAINANSTYSLENALRDNNAFDYYIKNTLLSGNDTIIGSPGNDHFYYTAGKDTIDGKEGSDWLDFSNEYLSNTLNIDLSTDKYTTGTGTSTVTSVVHNVENIIGSGSNDSITGNNSDNIIVGGSGNDVLKGGGGNDKFIASYSYNDTIDGGTGTDTVDYTSNRAKLNVNLNTGIAIKEYGYSYSDSDTLSNIENVIGSIFDDTITGNNLSNVINGGAGNDTLDGGAGFDTADYSTAYKSVTANLTTGSATGYGTDKLLNIENLMGSSYADKLSGNSGANTLKGGAGDDILTGGAGDDLLDGGAGSDWAYYDTVTNTTGLAIDLSKTIAQNTLAAGNDTFIDIENILGTKNSDTLTGNNANNTLNGGDSNDVLNGNGGNDNIIGGAGKDTLTGGTGKDSFTFNSVTESSTTNKDTITDFVRGADKINLSAIDADAFTNGNQTFTFITSSAAFTGPAQVKFANGLVLAEVTGDGVADFSISLTGITTLAATDFIL